MANLKDAFKIPYIKRPTSDGPLMVYKRLPCPKCKSLQYNYAVTNDTGSIQGCTKCNITFPVREKEEYKPKEWHKVK